MKLMVARPSASQNRFEPQRAQKPRRASGDERYQARLSDPLIESFSRLAALAATKCQLERRHWEQWQATTELLLWILSVHPMKSEY